MLCRVFGRSKSSSSLQKKLEKEPTKYAVGTRLIQDVIGIRVVLYFQEDIEIVKKALCKKYKFDMQSSTIDLPASDQFSVTRFNLIFKIPDQYLDSFYSEIADLPIDNTLEIQLRSMLSEGWHEVEHDMRYKNKENWDNQTDLSRALNGIMATLETSEWGMKKIFDDLAYRHYKTKNWNGMLQNKLRMRINSKLSEEISKLLDDNPTLAKEIYRIDKSSIIETIGKLHAQIPLSLDNLVYIWNFINLNNAEISAITPNTLIDRLQKI